VSSFHEPSDEEGEPHGGGWKRLEPPAVLGVYIAQGWHDAVAVDLNEETREVRVEWPPRGTGDPQEPVTHRVLGPDHYKLPAGGFGAG
jgi:hypothetical protein